MTRNVALRHWRHRTRELPEVVSKLAEHIRQLAEAQDAPSRYDEEVQALRCCMEQLPQKSRQLLELYYHADVSTPHIAARMEMNTGTVCRALSRLREKLRGCVQGVLAGGPAHV